jgi:hypothetical protein
VSSRASSIGIGEEPRRAPPRYLGDFQSYHDLPLCLDSLAGDPWAPGTGAGLGEFKPDGGAQEARLSIHVGSVHTEIPVVIKESIPNIDIPDPALLRVLAEDIVAGGPGSRWRARMLRITSAEWTPCAIASAAAPDARSGRPGHPKRERLVAPHALRAEPEWLDRPSAMGAADARP